MALLVVVGGQGAMQRREARAGLLFVLPWLLSLLLFTTYPVLTTLYLSFTDYNIVQPPRWIGVQNYRTMFTADPAFWTSVGNTSYYALLAVPLGLAGALGLALLLNTRARGSASTARSSSCPCSSHLSPAPSSSSPCSTPITGSSTPLLQQVGLPTVGWLTDPTWSKPALILLSLWGLGASALIFLAGLQEIPQALLDAAAIDGAGPWQRFRHVTLPLLTPVILFNLVMGVISSFHIFTQALVVGGTTGKPLESTLMFMVHIYRTAFRYFAMGQAAALAVVLFLAVLVVTLVIFRSAHAWVYYEGSRSSDR